MAIRNIPQYIGWRTAKKDHLCKGCGDKIPKGLRYWRVSDSQPPHFVQGAFCKPECMGRLQFFEKK